jgi:hypothetical protein
LENYSDVSGGIAFFRQFYDIYVVFYKVVHHFTYNLNFSPAVDCFEVAESIAIIAIPVPGAAWQEAIRRLASPAKRETTITVAVGEINVPDGE